MRSPDSGFLRFVALVALVTVARPAIAQDLSKRLADGPLVSVATDAKGKFDSATAIIEINRPPAEVWKVVTDFAHYTQFIPKVEESRAVTTKDGHVDVTLELDVPGPDLEYTCRYSLDPVHFSMDGRWLKGDLEGTYVKWRIEPLGAGGSLVYYTTSSRHFNAMLQSFEDDQQSITIGVNVGAALAAVKAVKRRTENPPAPAKAR